MMDAAEEFLHHLGKLEALLENDHDTADKNMQGGFVAPYRRGVERDGSAAGTDPKNQKYLNLKGEHYGQYFF